MPGTKSGGQKTRQTNITKYGEDYYQKLGKLGGKVGTGHDFAHGKLDPVATGKLGGRPRKEQFFIADAQIDNHIIEPFQKESFFRGWFKRSK